MPIGAGGLRDEPYLCSIFHNFLSFDRSQVIEVREKGVLVHRSIACAKLSVIAKKIG